MQDLAPVSLPKDNPELFILLEPALVPPFRLQHGKGHHTVTFTLSGVFEDLFVERPDIELHLRSQVFHKSTLGCSWNAQCKVIVNDTAVSIPQPVRVTLAAFRLPVLARPSVRVSASLHTS